MRASDLSKGVRLAGILPPVEGIRTEYAEPIVTRVRRRNSNFVVTWPDGSKAQYDADSEIEVA